ncbi:MAG: TVP38/TMEM64 family protein [Acetobacteraceae bacterium]
MKRRHRHKNGGTVVALASATLVLALLAAAGLAWLRSRHIEITMPSPAAIRGLIASWGVLAPLCALLLMVLHSFLPLPAEIIALANGMAFGPLLGGALTWAGAMVGAVLSFALARVFGDRLVRPLLGRARSDRPLPATAAGLLAARLIPVISFNLVNYGAGLAGVGWWTFLWTTALGILPLTIIMVVMGGRLTAAPRWLLAVLLGLAAVLLLVAGWRALRSRRRAGLGRGIR